MKKNKNLANRLSRIIGQIESIKQSLHANEEIDCVKTIYQLKASINGLKKFGESYINSHMKDCLENKSLTKEEIEKKLTDVIAGSFSL